MASRTPLRGGPLQKGIIGEARRQGWRVAHFTAVQTQRGWRTPVAADGKGFPDLLLVRERVLAIEVKGDGDKLRPDQVQWLEAFRLAGCTAVVVTPAMWTNGEVDQLLARAA